MKKVIIFIVFCLGVYLIGCLMAASFNPEYWSWTGRIAAGFLMFFALLDTINDPDFK